MADSSFLLDIVAKFEQSQKNLEAFSKDVKKATDKISKDFGLIKLAAFTTGLNQGIELAKKLGDALAEPIRQAAEFEADVNNLRIALDATGQSTDQVVNGFVDFAASLQETTKFSDNAVLSTSALIQNLAQLSGQELKVATKAALDLSTALGIDLNSAASLVAKAANGNVSAFKRYGIEIKAGKTDAETFANALEVLGKRFGGSSEKSVNTFAGSIAQLRNNFDDSLKTFGLAIIQNESLVKTINIVSAGFVSLTQTIKNNEGAIGTFVNKGLLVFNFALKATIPLLVGVTAAIAAYNIAVLAATVSSVGFRFALQYAAVSLKVFAVAASAAIVPMLPFLALGAAVVGLVAFATRIYMIRDAFVSLGDAVKAVLAETGGFLARLFGLDETAAKLDKTLSNLKQKKIDIDTGDAQANVDNLIKGAKSYRANIEEIAKAREIQQNKEREQFAETATANFDKIKEALQKAGKTEYELVVAQRDEQLKVLSDYAKIGADQEKEANRLRGNVNAEFEKKRNELNQKSNDFYAQEAEKLITKQKELKNALVGAGASIPAFIKNLDDLKKKGASQGELVATGAAAVAGSIVQGAEGARQAVVELGTQAAVAAFGPLGELARPLLDAFSKGPEEVKKLVSEFFGAIPGIIKNILLSVPAFILALIQSIPVLIDGLLSALPEVVNGFVDSIPLIIGALVALQPQVMQALIDNIPSLISALVFQMPVIATAFTGSLIQNIPSIAQAFIQQFVSGIPQIISGIAQGVADAIKNAVGLGGGSGGVLGKITNPVKSIGKKLGFADGGVIPGGFPNDTFPAQLTSGEGVVPNDTMRRLDQYLMRADNGGGSSGGGTTIIKLVVGEQELANVLLNLNRQGFRT